MYSLLDVQVVVRRLKYEQFWNIIRVNKARSIRTCRVNRAVAISEAAGFNHAMHARASSVCGVLSGNGLVACMDNNLSCASMGPSVNTSGLVLL